MMKKNDNDNKMCSGKLSDCNAFINFIKILNEYDEIGENSNNLINFYNKYRLRTQLKSLKKLLFYFNDNMIKLMI